MLRQDPDVILVGELRDLETMSVALTAAETGHLVFATLHTQDAAQTIDRVIDVFPPAPAGAGAVQLAGAPCRASSARRCAERPAAAAGSSRQRCWSRPRRSRNLIREGKTHQVLLGDAGRRPAGMHTMDQHLAELVRSGRITYPHGLEKCHHVEDFDRLTGRG